MSEATEILDKLGSPLAVLAVGEGERLTNQSGGFACRHPEIRGNVLVSGASKESLQIASDSLESFFCSDKWGGWCCEKIDKETARVVDAIFGTIYPGFETDKSKYKKSMEAWVWGKLDGKPVVAVWENSD